jgi:hypothetical protein
MLLRMVRVRRILALGIVLGIGVVVPAAASTIPAITRGDAAHYSKVALKADFKGYFYAGGFRARCRLTDRTHARCQVGWFQGDFFFNGTTRIWYTQDAKGVVFWNDAYRIVRTNDYCRSVQHRRHCTRTFQVN